MDELPPGRSNQVIAEEPARVPAVSIIIERLRQQADLDPAEVGTRICVRCHQFFDYAPRSQGELERLHQALFVTGPHCAHVHFYCGGCYDIIVGTALTNEQVETVGISNMGPPNIALRRLA